MKTLTIDQLVLWLAELGIQKVEPTLQSSPSPEAADRMREAGMDPDRTTWITTRPKQGPYYSVVSFPGDDTGGKPVINVCVHPFDEPLVDHPGLSYRDGDVVFEATATGEVESFGFGESYSGSVIWASQENDTAVPTTLAELKTAFEFFWRLFAEFVADLDKKEGDQE